MSVSLDDARRAQIAERFDHIKIVPYSDDYLLDTVAVAHEIHKTSIYAHLPLDEMKLINRLKGAGAGVAQNTYFKLAVRQDRVVGGFLGWVSVTFFSDDLLARDMGWWVPQSARGGAAAVLLLADFERWARTKGAKKCMIGQTGVDHLERTAKLFRHCGYEFVGINAAKDL